MRQPIMMVVMCACTLVLGVRVLAAQGASCAGTLPSQLSIGSQAQVLPGSANNVRDVPARDGQLVGQLPAGTVVDVLAGPTCADDLAWWQVRTLDAVLTGWTVEAVGQEYALAPFDALRPALPDGWKRAEEGGTSVGVNPALFDTPTVFHDVGTDLADAGDGLDALFIAPSVMIVLMRQQAFVGLVSVSATDVSARTNPVQAEVIVALQDLLARRPAPTSAQLTLLGQFGELPMVWLHGTYLDTGLVRGVRAVAYLPPDPSLERMGPALNYAFHGLSADGRFRVRAIFPLTANANLAPFGPLAPDMEVFQPRYIAYVEQQAAHIDSLDPAVFSPPLAELDAVIATIGLDPDVLLAEALAQVAALGDTRPPVAPPPSDAAAAGGGVALANADVVPLVRALPGAADASYLLFEPSARVVDGPVCVDKTRWWLLTTDTHAAWVAEVTVTDAGLVTMLQSAADGAPLSDVWPGAEQAASACVLFLARRPQQLLSVVPFTVSTRTYPPELPTPNVVRADALVSRDEGGYRYWRLAPGASAMDGSVLGVVYVAEGAGVPSALCAEVPVIRGL